MSEIYGKICMVFLRCVLEHVYIVRNEKSGYLEDEGNENGNEKCVGSFQVNKSKHFLSL